MSVLKGIVSDELDAMLDAELAGKDEAVKLANLRDGRYVDVARHRAVEQQRDELKADLAQRGEELEQLRQSAGSGEATQKALEKLQAEHEAVVAAHAKEMQRVRKEAAIRLDLSGDVAAPEFADYIIGKLDEAALESIELAADGSIAGGWQEHRQAWVKEKPALFKPAKAAKPSINIWGAKPAEGAVDGGLPYAEANPWAEKTYNLTRQGEIFKADPEKARELAAAAQKKF